jgi:dephospho-CoA kinase
MVLKVGLTGGIGSGKSTVARVFEVLGIPVYYADAEAKRLMNEDAGLKQGIMHHFGSGAYSNGVLNRSFISGIVFNDPAKLELLNSLVHPVTKKNAEAWMLKQTSPYAIHEAALIFEAGVNERLDYVIGVSAPQPLRIQRAVERDGMAVEEILKRMNQQMGEDEKMKRCDFVVINDEQQLLIPQVLALHQKLLALSK